MSDTTEAKKPVHAYTAICVLVIATVQEGMPYSFIRTCSLHADAHDPKHAADMAIATTHDDFVKHLREGETISDVMCIGILPGHHANVLPPDYEFGRAEKDGEGEDAPFVELHGEDDDGEPLL